MKSLGRELAKVAAGFAASETLGHWWIGIWGAKLLPMDLGWFTFTREMNQIVMIVWPLVLLALIIYAWGTKAQEKTPASFGRSVPV
jgi:hypothetical protein